MSRGGLTGDSPDSPRHGHGELAYSVAMKRRSPLLLVLAAALVAAPLAACTAGPGSAVLPEPAVDATAPSEAGRGLSELDASQAEAGGVAGAEDGGDGGSDSATAERSVIRTGELALEVTRPAESADEVTGIAEELGGSIALREVRQPWGDSGTTATLVVRVPSDRFDEAFERLSEVGDVRSESRNASDVTEQRADLDARVQALEASVDRLRELMRGSASTSDLLEAEQALSERQQELDGLRAQLKSLEGQVDEASITVTLSAPSALPGGGPATFWDGLLAGLASLAATGSALLVALGVALPWLVVLALIALAVLLIVRSAIRRGRRRRAGAASAAQVRTTEESTHAAPATAPGSAAPESRESTPPEAGPDPAAR